MREWSAKSSFVLRSGAFRFCFSFSLIFCFSFRVSNVCFFFLQFQFIFPSLPWFDDFISLFVLHLLICFLMMEKSRFLFCFVLVIVVAIVVIVVVFITIEISSGYTWLTLIISLELSNIYLFIYFLYWRIFFFISKSWYYIFYYISLSFVFIYGYQFGDATLRIYLMFLFVFASLVNTYLILGECRGIVILYSFFESIAVLL